MSMVQRGQAIKRREPSVVMVGVSVRGRNKSTCLVGRRSNISATASNHPPPPDIFRPVPVLTRLLTVGGGYTSTDVFSVPGSCHDCVNCEPYSEQVTIDCCNYTFLIITPGDYRMHMFNKRLQVNIALIDVLEETAHRRLSPVGDGSDTHWVARLEATVASACVLRLRNAYGRTALITGLEWDSRGVTVVYCERVQSRPYNCDNIGACSGIEQSSRRAARRVGSSLNNERTVRLDDLPVGWCLGAGCSCSRLLPSGGLNSAWPEIRLQTARKVFTRLVIGLYGPFPPCTCLSKEIAYKFVNYVPSRNRIRHGDYPKPDRINQLRTRADRLREPRSALYSLPEYKLRLHRLSQNGAPDVFDSSASFPTSDWKAVATGKRILKIPGGRHLLLRSRVFATVICGVEITTNITAFDGTEDCYRQRCNFYQQNYTWRQETCRPPQRGATLTLPVSWEAETEIGNTAWINIQEGVERKKIEVVDRALKLCKVPPFSSGRTTPANRPAGNSGLSRGDAGYAGKRLGLIGYKIFSTLPGYRECLELGDSMLVSQPRVSRGNFRAKLSPRPLHFCQQGGLPRTKTAKRASQHRHEKGRQSAWPLGYNNNEGRGAGIELTWLKFSFQKQGVLPLVGGVGSEARAICAACEGVCSRVVTIGALKGNLGRDRKSCKRIGVLGTLRDTSSAAGTRRADHGATSGSVSMSGQPLLDPGMKVGNFKSEERAHLTGRNGNGHQSDNSHCHTQAKRLLELKCRTGARPGQGPARGSGQKPRDVKRSLRPYRSNKKLRAPLPIHAVIEYFTSATADTRHNCLYLSAGQTSADPPP
ncbi:hypothetical protein AAG570_009297 [Ranatra chinensis]|uniref:Uncharacterized protein n=1 Tax=Ranatra chinensis TaxID=642074 RepID=A0ABD0YP75_9HEMI